MIFAYATEKLNHYILNSECVSHLKALYPGQLQKAVQQAIAQQVQLESHQKLRCDVCNRDSDSVLDYCMHRDNHGREDKTFGCFECGKLMWSPYAYYRHDCVLTYLAAKQGNCQARKDLILTPGANYPALETSVKESLLTCFCGKTFNFAIHLMNHWIAEISCLRPLISLVKDKNHESISFSKLWVLHRSQRVKCIICCECGLTLANQVVYMLHQDHHQIPNKLTCKGCNIAFSTPCQFFKHQCLVSERLKGLPKRYTCLVCEKFESSLSAKGPVNEGLALQIENVQQAVDWNSEPLNEFIEEAMDIKEEPLSRDFDDDHEEYTSSYDRERSMWKILKRAKPQHEWFVCIDCDPLRILQIHDGSLDGHMKEYENHYRIDPAWLYSKLELNLKDLRMTTEYHDMIESNEEVLCSSKRQRLE